VLIELLGDFLESADLRRETRVAPATIPQRADTEPECCQLFAKLIVHFTRDTPSLVFLREDEARQQLGSCTFGALAFLHLFPQRRVGQRELRGSLVDANLEQLVRTPERFLRTLAFRQIEMCADD